MLRGSGVEPQVDFSFTEFDFGPCFLHRVDMPAKRTTLTITNNDSKDVRWVMNSHTPSLSTHPHFIHTLPTHLHFLHTLLPTHPHFIHTLPTHLHFPHTLTSHTPSLPTHILTSLTPSPPAHPHISHSVNCLFTNQPSLSVQFESQVLSPEGEAEAVVEFCPKELTTFCELVVFEINGLSKKTVTIHGDGVPMKVISSDF